MQIHAPINTKTTLSANQRDLFEQMNRRAWIESSESNPVVQISGPPEQAPDHVLVRMRAAALNFADLLKAAGRYQEAEAFPFVPGLEGAGEVVSAPPGSGFHPGDRLAVNTPGTLADLVNVPPACCQRIPDNMSFEQAAGFQIAYGTSHLALTTRAALQPQETLVVLGAAGGVGLTAVQIGAALGARVIGVARGAMKLHEVQKAGATIAIDSEEKPDLRQVLRDLGGVDVVYDPVGGALGEAAFGALRQGGRFLVIGFAGGQPPTLKLNHALVKNIAVHGFYWGGYRRLNPPLLQDSLRTLFTMFAAGKLTPLTYETLPLDRVAEGFQRLRSRASIGKIIITL